MRSGACWARTMWVRRTDGNGFGYWRTPTAQEAGARIESLYTKEGEPAKVGQRAYRKQPDGRMVLQSQTLGQQVRYPTPRTQMARNGTGKEDRNKCNLEEVVGGQLNPTWVEWLMGWCLGWTDLRPLATDKFRQWLEQHGDC